jgi:tetratricopeptide (TPR) repeat protein
VDAATVDYQPAPAAEQQDSLARVADAAQAPANAGFEPQRGLTLDQLHSGAEPARARYDANEAAAFLQRVAALCAQLGALHAAGVCHGAVTPQSAFWNGQYWIIDRIWMGAFAGASDRAALFPDQDPMLDFLAPEMRSWSAPPSSAADVYGVGALAYAGLTGQPPRALKRADWAMSARDWVIHDGETDANRLVAAWPKTVPRRWALIISRALEADPARRQQSMRELETELARCRWPDDAVAAMVDQARTDFRQGRTVEAYDLLDAAQRLDPGSPAVHHARAECFFGDGGFEFALEENKAAYDVDPSPEVCFLHAECLAQLADFEAALALAREGLAQKDCARGRRLLGTLLVRTGLKEAGLKELEAGLRIAERNREIEEVERIHAAWGVVSEQPPTTQSRGVTESFDGERMA